MPSCAAKRLEQQRKRRQQTPQQKAAKEKKAAESLQRRVEAERQRKFVAYYSKQIISHTRPSKMRMPEMPLTRAQEAILSQADKNEKGRKESEELLFKVHQDWRKELKEQAQDWRKELKEQAAERAELRAAELEAVLKILEIHEEGTSGK